MRVKKADSLEIALYMGYLIPITLFFFLNPVTSDIRTHKLGGAYFPLLYISFASSFLLCLKLYILGPKPRWSTSLTLLIALTLMLLVCTFLFNTIPEQATVKLMAQLILMTMVCVASYLIGTQFEPSKIHKIITIVITALACLSAFYGIFSLRNNEYFFYLRPYGWSNYMLPFFLYWILKIDCFTPRVLRYSGALLLMVLVVLSGTRTILVWTLFAFLLANPKKAIFRGLILLGLGAVGTYIYFNLLQVEGAEALVERYQKIMSDNRSPLWMAAWERITSNNLIFGGGFFAYPLLPSGVGDYVRSAHNTYLHLLLIGGGIGLFIGLWMLGIFVLQYWRVAPGIVLFLPIVGMIGELPLYPQTYSRIFENASCFFLLGLLSSTLQTRRRKHTRKQLLQDSMRAPAYAN